MALGGIPREVDQGARASPPKVGSFLAGAPRGAWLQRRPQRRTADRLTKTIEGPACPPLPVPDLSPALLDGAECWPVAGEP